MPWPSLFVHCQFRPLTHLKWLKLPIASIKSVKLYDSLNHSFLHLQCFFLHKSTCELQIGCTTFCVPQINWFIEFVKFLPTISLSVTMKTGILFSKLLFILYNQYPYRQYLDFFFSSQAVVLFCLPRTSFSAINHCVFFLERYIFDIFINFLFCSFIPLAHPKVNVKRFSFYLLYFEKCNGFI